MDEKALERWADSCGWQVLLNRRGTTFRKLEEADKADIDAAQLTRTIRAVRAALQ